MNGDGTRSLPPLMHFESRKAYVQEAADRLQQAYFSLMDSVEASRNGDIQKEGLEDAILDANRSAWIATQMMDKVYGIAKREGDIQRGKSYTGTGPAYKSSWRDTSDHEPHHDRKNSEPLYVQRLMDLKSLEQDYATTVRRVVERNDLSTINLPDRWETNPGAKEPIPAEG